ncbi:hypothetical protein [Synechococcus phage S-H25]|nr:hypothetical protein [Synechococcus phage S-H25]
MRKLLPLVMLLMAAPAHADITHKLSSSVQLTVDAAATNVQRIGNSYSVSGNGVTLDVSGGTGSEDLQVGGLGTLSSGVAPGVIPTAIQTTDGASFTFSNSFTAGDAVITTAPTVGAVSAFSNQTSTAAGSAGSLAGTITSAGAVTLTAGGAGTSATGQYVSEITVR